VSTHKTRPIPTTVALLVGTLLASMDVTVVGTAMPRITGKLGGLELYPWVFSVYLLASTVTGPIWGKLADLFGRKPTYLVSMSLFLLGSAACGAAPSMAWLVAARALQGVGAGANFTLTQTIFGDIFPIETRAKMQGIFSFVWGISSVIGPAVGGAIVTYWSWPWVFLINLPIGIAGLLAFVAYFHEQVEKKPHTLDILGALLLSGSITIGLAGMTRPPMLAAAAALLVLFFLVERRAAEPILPLDLFKDRVIAIAAVTGLLTGPLLFAFIAYVPLYLQGALAVEPMWAGLVMAPMSVGWSSATFLGGRLILKSGFRPLVRGGALLIALSCVVLWHAMGNLPTTQAWIEFLAADTVFGAGMGAALSAVVIATQERVSWQRRGVATAIVGLSRQVGSTLGVAAFGAIITASLAKRLLTVANAPPPSALLDPHRLSELSPSVLAASRDALAQSLLPIFFVLMLISVAALALSFSFPDLKAKKTD
jgi:EmrB/QacA subfamily drug resistance transporter